MGNVFVVEKNGTSTQLDYSIFDVDQENQMVNITKLAKPFGKLTADWVRLKTTKSLIDSFNKRYTHMGIPITVKTSAYGEQGTWVHRKLAILFAMWISPDFSLWVADVLDHLFQTGSITLTNKSSDQLLLMNEENRKKIEIYNQVVECEDFMYIGEVAKILGTGRNRLIQIFNLMKFIDKHEVPYQKTINNKLMAMKVDPVTGIEYGAKSVIFITPAMLPLLFNLITKTDKELIAFGKKKIKDIKKEFKNTNS